MRHPEIVNFYFEVVGATADQLVVSGSISKFTMENAARAGSRDLEQYLGQVFGDATRMLIEKISEPVRAQEAQELHQRQGLLIAGAAIAREEQRKKE